MPARSKSTGQFLKKKRAVATGAGKSHHSSAGASTGKKSRGGSSSAGGLKGALKGAVPKILAGAAGFAATRWGAAFVLEKLNMEDEGVTGYAANAAVGVGGYLLLKKLGKPELATGFLVGSGIAIAMRAVADFSEETAAKIGVTSSPVALPSASAPAGVQGVYRTPAMAGVYRSPRVA
jgi:hypothetical protein